MKRFFKSMWNALRGIAIGLISERHLRIHAFFIVAVLALSLYFQTSLLENAIILLCVGIVWTAELFNSAIERIADRITRENDLLIRDAKDLSAGAVLFAVFSAIAVGLVIFVPKVLDKFGF